MLAVGVPDILSPSPRKPSFVAPPTKIQGGKHAQINGTFAVAPRELPSTSTQRPRHSQPNPPTPPAAPAERILAVSSSFRGLRLACVTERSLSIFGGTNTATRLAHVFLPSELIATNNEVASKAFPLRVECHWKQSADALVICRLDTGAVGFFSLRPTDVPTVNLRMAEWSHDAAELLPQENALHVTYLGGIHANPDNQIQYVADTFNVDKKTRIYGLKTAPAATVTDGISSGGHLNKVSGISSSEQQKYQCISVTTGRGVVYFGTACGLLLSVSWQHQQIIGALALQHFHASFDQSHTPPPPPPPAPPSLSHPVETETETEIDTSSIPTPPSPLVLCDLSAGGAPSCLGFVCSNGNAGVVQLPPFSSPLWTTHSHYSKQLHQQQQQQQLQQQQDSGNNQRKLWCVLIPSSRVVRVCLAPSRPLLAVARVDSRVDIFRFTPPPLPRRTISTTTTHHHNNYSDDKPMNGVPPPPPPPLSSNPPSSTESIDSGAILNLDLVSSLSLRAWDISPAVSGGVTDMAWSWRPDDCLAVVYERIGHMVWTVDGACRLSSFAPSVVVAPASGSNNNKNNTSTNTPSSHSNNSENRCKETSNANANVNANANANGSAGQYTSVAWTSYGYQLVVARNNQSDIGGSSDNNVRRVNVSSAGAASPVPAQASPFSTDQHEQGGGGQNSSGSTGTNGRDGDVCDLTTTPHMLCYSIVKVCEPMSLRRNGPERMCLVGAKHVLLLSTPPWNNHELGWQMLEPPRVYVEQNGPMLSVAFSDDCSQLALAGKTGLALFSLQTKRWRLFGNVNHERAIACEGLFWWGNDVICVVNYDGSCSASSNVNVKSNNYNNNDNNNNNNNNNKCNTTESTNITTPASSFSDVDELSNIDRPYSRSTVGKNDSTHQHHQSDYGQSVPHGSSKFDHTEQNAGEYSLMCYPRTHLDNHSLLFTVKLPSKPICVDCHINQQLLIIQFAHSVGIYHVNAHNLSRSHSFTLSRNQDQSNVEQQTQHHKDQQQSNISTTDDNIGNERNHQRQQQQQQQYNSTNTTDSPRPSLSIHTHAHPIELNLGRIKNNDNNNNNTSQSDTKTEDNALRFRCSLVKAIQLRHHHQRQPRARLAPFKSLVLLPSGGTRVPGSPVKLPRCVVLDNVGDLSVLNTEDESLTSIQKNVTHVWSYFYWHPTGYLSSPPWPPSLSHVVWVVDHDALRLWVPALDPEAQLLKSPDAWSMPLDPEVCALGIHPHFNTLVGISQRRAKAPGLRLVSLEIDTRVQPVIQSLLAWLVQAKRDQMLLALLMASRHSVPFLQQALELWLFEAVEHDYVAVRMLQRKQQRRGIAASRSSRASLESTGLSAAPAVAVGASQGSTPATSHGRLSRVSSFASAHSVQVNPNSSASKSMGNSSRTSSMASMDSVLYPDGKKNINDKEDNEDPCATSQAVLRALRRFDALIYAQVLLAVARKAEPSRTATVLFRTPVSLHRVIDYCLSHGHLRLAAAALPLLDRVAVDGEFNAHKNQEVTESWSEARTIATRRVWHAAVAAKDDRLVEEVRATAKKRAFVLDP